MLGRGKWSRIFPSHFRDPIGLVYVFCYGRQSAHRGCNGGAQALYFFTLLPVLIHHITVVGVGAGCRVASHLVISNGFRLHTDSIHIYRMRK
jgi:hypothetical protein